VLFYVPLVPTKSIRVRPQGTGEHPFPIGVSWSDSYAVFEKSPPNRKQVVYTYSYMTFMAAWVFLVGFIAIHFSLFPPILTIFSVSIFFIACAIPVPTPWILRYYAYRKLRTNT
jgi:hypothetical protein